MTRNDQQTFVCNFMDQVKAVIHEEIESGKIPANWDGFELRAYIAQAFKQEEAKMPVRRRQAFLNDCRVLPLKY